LAFVRGNKPADENAFTHSSNSIVRSQAIAGCDRSHNSPWAASQE
jgi:hypothetical protein